MASEKAPEMRPWLQASFCAAASALLLCSFVTGTASAQAYPTKPIRFIVGFLPGGGTDVMARTLSRKLSDSMGQQVIVDNRAGGGGLIAAVLAAKAPPDGYTLFAATISALATNVSMYSKLPYDPVRDFAPVTLMMKSPFLFLVHPSIPVTTLKEFIALAKASPRRLNYGTASSGSVSHIAQEMFNFMAGVEIVHVPYKGAADQLTALITREVQSGLIQIQVALPQVRAGKIKPLAITSAQRLAAAPEVPTVSEAGVPGYEATSWMGVVVPAGTPPAIVNRLHVEIAKALQAADLKERLAAEGSTPGGITPAEFEAHIKSEIAKWARVVKASGARAD